MRVFDCACWPNLRPYNSHKLQPRSIQCVFLGYSLLHKGYKCLHLPSGHVYISRDVLFNEDIFPFAKACSTTSQSLSSLNFTSFHLQPSTGLHAAAPLSIGPFPSTYITQNPPAHTEAPASPQLLAHSSPTLPHYEPIPLHIPLPPTSYTNTTLAAGDAPPLLPTDTENQPSHHMITYMVSD